MFTFDVEKFGDNAIIWNLPGYTAWRMGWVLMLGYSIAVPIGIKCI
jgi:hypothetical protein